jgi:hypothetical protein
MAFRIVSLFLILLFTSCEELEIDEDSIFEADPSEQIPVINEIEENINNDEASFFWFDHSDFALEFSYKLEYSGPADSEPLVHQSYFDWSDWTTSKAESFSSLDEGNYTFYVKSRFDESTEEEEPHKFVGFEINNINGPALRIYPLNQTAQTGDEIDVYLYFEEVNSLSTVTGLHVDIQINSSELEFVTDQFDRGDLIDSFPGTMYPNPSYSDDNTSISIIMGVLDDINQNGLGIYGTGSIAKIRLKVLTCCGGQNINIDQIDVLDSNGDPYNTFNDPVGGTVMVE